MADTRENAAMLLTHSVAATAGHAGTTRRDERARRDRRPADVRAGVAGHRPGSDADLSTCWSVDLDKPVREHMSLEAEGRRGARRGPGAHARSSGSPAAPSQRITATVARCARQPRLALPARLTNQIDWSAEMYAAAATVTGRSDLLLRDYRPQLADFAAGSRAR